MKRIISILILSILAVAAAGAVGAQPGPEHRADGDGKRAIRELPLPQATPTERVRRPADPYPPPATDVFGPPPQATPFTCPTAWTEEIIKMQVCYFCPNDPEPAVMMFCYPIPTAAPIDGPEAYPPPVVSTPVPYPSPDICSGDPNPCEG